MEVNIHWRADTSLQELDALEKHPGSQEPTESVSLHLFLLELIIP